MNDTEKNRLLRSILQDLPGISKDLQGLQMGISRWLPGFKPGEMQDKEMLSDQRTCYLRRLQRL